MIMLHQISPGGIIAHLRYSLVSFILSSAISCCYTILEPFLSSLVYDLFYSSTGVGVWICNCSMARHTKTSCNYCTAAWISPPLSSSLRYISVSQHWWQLGSEGLSFKKRGERVLLIFAFNRSDAVAAHFCTSPITFKYMMCWRHSCSGHTWYCSTVHFVSGHVRWICLT